MMPRQAPEHKPWRIAHRGAKDEAPENTQVAFERALAYPIDGIELDVQMSADGVPVLYHDRTLSRVMGRRKRLAEFTHGQLAKMDWGAWFGSGFSGTPLFTLDQTLKAFGNRTRLLVEIKSRPAEQASGHAHRLTEAVVDLLDAQGPSLSTEHIHILSFDPQVLVRGYQLAPRWRYVLNISERRPNFASVPESRVVPCLWAVCVKISRLSHPLVQWARGHGLRVFTYTCNGPRQVKKALGLKVDAILTDRPGWLTKHMENLL